MEEPVENNGETPPTDSVECTSDVCSGGTANYQPLTGTMCTMGGIFCNAGDCVECLMAGTCPDASGTDCIIPTCSPEGACGTGPRALGQLCTGGGTVCNATGVCVACNVPADCPDPGPCKVKSCAGGACTPGNASDGTPCTNGQCSGGVCKLSAGQPCQGPGDCFTNNCPLPEGICCNLPCAGPCKSCGTGVCTNAMPGTDPQDECSLPGPQNCDGNGMCGP
jgi:hypothetical protein